MGHPVHGTDVCRMHGGEAPQVLAAGQRRIAEAAAREAVKLYGLPVDVDPGEALLTEVRWTAGHVLWLRGAVQELEASNQVIGGAFGGAHPWVDLYREERKHLVNVCTAALRAGIEERQVRLAEKQGELIADVIRQLLDDPELGLNPDQRERGRAIASQRLRVLASA
jgi:plasmid stabilization system protein ParE